MEIELQTFTNELTPTSLSVTDNSFSWKLAEVEEIPLSTSSWFPQTLADLNRKSPLAYQLMNCLRDLLPASECAYSFKPAAAWLAQGREVMNRLSEVEIDADINSKAPL